MGEKMLLEFRAENYRSFKDELFFSMYPDNSKKELCYSFLKENVQEKEYSGLCSSVIYGPNASGKTNVIGAMDSFKKILLRGNINSVEMKISNNVSPNYAAYDMALIPNNTTQKKSPVSFSIKFITDNMLFEYGFSADWGRFLEKNYKRKVLSEFLKINNDVIFTRGKEIEFGKNIKVYSNDVFINNMNAGIQFANEGLKDDELFLANGFKTLFSKDIENKINDWLEYKFLVIYDSNHYNSIVRNANKDTEDYSGFVAGYIQEYAKNIGIMANNIGYMNDEEKHQYYMCSLFDKQKIVVPSTLVESFGTIRLINLFHPILDALLNGNTLVIDEFDSSLHPMIVMNFINLFHNPDINKNNAQLIFNTHNPIFLNKDLFRRDEIKFVERVEDKYSELYSLADFPVLEEDSKEVTQDYMKNYFINRYGAIKNIDLTDFFDNLINNNKFTIKKGKQV